MTNVTPGPRLRWETGFAPGHGVRLFVRRVVEPPGQPVLLLHGLGVSGSVLQPFARRLLPELAAVVPDLRGHGQSDAPDDGYLPADYAGDLVELITQDDSLTRVPVVGHSLGALVGMHLASQRPELVEWLVLLDPPLDPRLRNSEVDAVYRLRHATAGELEAYLLERDPGGGELLANALAKEFRAATDAAFETLQRARPFTALPVAAPTLVVQADPAHGGVLGDQAAAAAVATLGSARLRKIAGATHAVHASHPAEVAAAIRECARHSKTSPTQ
ncbi:MAG: alpha/beta hydrolase [Chloroflexi bacterium]|nr:alpha/beta hydrolase [Chloroflexota bacterium]